MRAWAYGAAESSGGTGAHQLMCRGVLRGPLMATHHPK